MQLSDMSIAYSYNIREPPVLGHGLPSHATSSPGSLRKIRD